MRSSLVIGAGLAIAACTVIPAVPTRPLAGQTPQQEAQDGRECAEAAKPKGAPSWEACMIARRYRVTHHVVGSFGFGFQKEIDLTMQTEATQPRTAEQVTADIDTCRAQLRARDTKTVMGGAEPDRVSKLARYYTDCMEPRGYKLTLWEPK
jgi:hypothetical protein